MRTILIIFLMSHTTGVSWSKKSSFHVPARITQKELKNVRTSFFFVSGYVTVGPKNNFNTRVIVFLRGALCVWDSMRVVRYDLICRFICQFGVWNSRSMTSLACNIRAAFLIHGFGVFWPSKQQCNCFQIEKPAIVLCPGPAVFLFPITKYVHGRIVCFAVH